ncbi:voltage-gated potassium channel [Aureococcus anophagefferens]|nr:voltage-gated potassium channel [Aureococcus anophagefferens]
MVHFDACDGTWTPALPAAVGAVKDGDDDAAYAAAKALGAGGGDASTTRTRSTRQGGVAVLNKGDFWKRRA